MRELSLLGTPNKLCVTMEKEEEKKEEILISSDAPAPAPAPAGDAPVAAKPKVKHASTFQLTSKKRKRNKKKKGPGAQAAGGQTVSVTSAKKTLSPAKINLETAFKDSTVEPGQSKRETITNS